LTRLKKESIIKHKQKVGLAAKGGNYERAKKLNARLGESVDPADLNRTI
jgi:hypothetical protein